MQDTVSLLLVTARAHNHLLNTSISHTAIWHLLHKLLLAGKWGRSGIRECKSWKDELTWPEGAVLSSQCLYRLLPFRHNRCKHSCRWLSLSTWRTRWCNLTITSEYGCVLEKCQPVPILPLGNEKCCASSWHTFSQKYSINVIGFTSPTDQARPCECLMSLYIQGMRRKTSFDIKQALSRHHLSAEECGQACFTDGHRGQQPSFTICV